MLGMMLGAGDLMAKQEKRNNCCHQESYGLIEEARNSFFKRSQIEKEIVPWWGLLGEVRVLSSVHGG